MGTVFTLNKDGSDFTLLHNFQSNEGALPDGALVESSDGTLYGSVVMGKPAGAAVFRLRKDGSGFLILQSFASPFSRMSYGPIGDLCFGRDGAIYSTLYSGGEMDLGQVFRIVPPVRPSIQYRSTSIGLNFAGNAGQSYTIEATTNLSSSNWKQIGNSTADINNQIHFSDSSISNYTTRFYRIANP